MFDSIFTYCETEKRGKIFNEDIVVLSVANNFETKTIYNLLGKWSKKLWFVGVLSKTTHRYFCTHSHSIPYLLIRLSHTHKDVRKHFFKQVNAKRKTNFSP
jgi:hypothetical protein